MPSLSIKDPVHGTLELTELEARLIDCSDFQRLRGIRQLAVAHLVYPGANHTRFEHSLGTLHLASLISEKIDATQEDNLKIRLCALLHDLGHIAFSHESERVTRELLGTHEEIGVEKMLSGKMGEILSENFGKKEILRLEKSPHAQIISSDIGADRMDYLKRDAHYTGVAYGIIDGERIIHKMHFSGGELWVEAGALEAAESLLIARFMMFSTVYLHHTVRIASAMLSKSLELAIDGGMSPKILLSLGDSEAISLLSSKKKAGFYAKSLFERNLYKQVYAFNPSLLDEKNKKNAEQELSSLAGCDILIDLPLAFSKPSGFKVKMHDGNLEEIGKISELVRALKSAEESRKKALVLAPEKFREKTQKSCKKYFGD